jgi:hypothetical protein
MHGNFQAKYDDLTVYLQFTSTNAIRLTIQALTDYADQIDAEAARLIESEEVPDAD